MRVFVIVVSLIITGCKDNNKESFEWAIYFCGSEKEIQSFILLSSRHTVYCKDGRMSDIPRK